ncbi:hypothetical protein GS597_12505 [Synechococcales cyanobacterium C]|uniref:Uncharacterized protein n=1 Tax=Petrachloros mirabilis ULC683 TaxID=2781853 RepID=A0A8K2A0F5_9CYAN|nr:hypothetical protein [Petrachloros mirabilis]NCJ07313.1 hypothetical protein [Petrachloros mirabilis ULC683]
MHTLPLAEDIPTWDSTTQGADQPIVRVLQSIHERMPGVVWDACYVEASEKTALPLAESPLEFTDQLTLGISSEPLAEQTTLISLQKKKSPALRLIRAVSWRLQKWGLKGGLLVSPGLSQNLNPSQASMRAPVGTPTRVRGVASMLHLRRLVLVSPENTILDILSPWQQFQLQRRIQWQLFRVRVREPLTAIKTALTALPGVMMQLPPALRRLRIQGAQIVLPVLRQGKHWLQPYLQAALPRLRQSRQRMLPLVQHSLQRVSPQILPRLQVWRRQLQPWWSVLVSLLALVPFSLGVSLPARAARPSLQAYHAASASSFQPLWERWLGQWNSPPSVVDPSGEVVSVSPLDREGTVLPGVTLSPLKSAHSSASALNFRTQTQSPLEVSPMFASAVDVDAIFVGYEFHPLERLLIGLDRALAWLETQFTQLWHVVSPWLKAWGSKFLL